MIPQLPAWLAALLQASLYGSILVAALALAQPLLRRWLSARWRCALWLLVLLRFVPLPLPPSPFLAAPQQQPPQPQPRSIPLMVDATWDQEQAKLWQSHAPAPVPAINVQPGAPSPAAPALTPPTAQSSSPDARGAGLPAPSPPAPGKGIWGGYWLVGIYLAGTLVMFLRFAAATFSLNRIVRRARPVADPALLQLLQACRGSQRAPRLLATEEMFSPALTGVLRPAILMPANLLKQLSPGELRQVFQHEVEHMRRRDVPVTCLLSLLHVLHWFNPALWAGLALARGERELACDEAVLARVNPADYGNTLLKLMETARPVRFLTPAVGVIETGSFMARRIRMIAQFKPLPAWPVLPAAALLGVMFLLTGPVSRGHEAAFPNLAGDFNVRLSLPSTNITPVGNVAFHGPFGRESLAVTSGKLPAHDLIDISFDLLILRSWDGSVNPDTEDQMPVDIGPDCFRLALRDGPTLLYTTFSNTPDDPPGFAAWNKRQNYPSQVPGQKYLAWNAAATRNTLGYFYPFSGPPAPVPMDATYHIHFLVPHTADSATLEMTGINLQSLVDENWGVRNVSIKAVQSHAVTRPSEKEIAAAFAASLGTDGPDLPGQFQVLINGMDETVAYLEKQVAPMPVDAARLAALVDDLRNGRDAAGGMSTHIALLSMGHAIEPALRDARRDWDTDQQERADAVLSVLEVRPPSANAAARDWLFAPPGAGRPTEAMRRVVMATRALEIIGTPRALALRNKLTQATSRELAALPRPPAPLHPGASADDHFAQKLQELLGVADTGADLLPALADAEHSVLGNKAAAGISRFKNLPGDTHDDPVIVVPPEVDASLDALTAALLKGPHVTALIEKYLPLVEIGNEHGGSSDNPVFDVDQHLERLCWVLWGRARMVAATNPSRASDLARAAMMLGAVADYDLEWGAMVNKVVQKDSGAEQLLNLPAGKLADLQKLIQTRLDQEKVVDGGGALFMIDLMTDARDKPVDMEQVRQIVADFDASFRSGMPQLGLRFRTLDLTWQFLNLMKQRKCPEGEQAVRTLMASWKKDYPDPDLARWIEQALTRDGPPPANLVGFYIDGKSMNAAEFMKYAQQSNDPTLKAMTQPATRPSSPP